MKFGYRETLPDLKQDCRRIAALDLGVNNLAVCSSNVMDPLVIDGKYLKSVNQRSNKALAASRSYEEKQHGRKNSPKIQAIFLRRNNRISDYLHKASRYLVNQFVFNQIDTVIIGHNPGWKQDTNIGKRNNQNFCQIPFNVFIRMLEYKCRMAGIQVILCEESYTSKCSFLDDEECRKQQTYKGKRIQRGLYKSQNGKLINADQNGSLNILKKALLTLGQWNRLMYQQCLDRNEKAALIRYNVPRS